MFVIISKYPKGASLDASAYLSDNIKNKCPREAKKPTAAIIDHWLRVGQTQKVGVNNDMMVAPTAPVNNKVNNGLSDVESFLVTIK